MKKNTLICLICLFASIMTNSVFSADFIHEDQIHITNLHTIDDDIYAFGENITIDGKINGDAMLGGYKVVTNGTINHSANVFAYDCTINGNIEGALRVFANSMTLNGEVHRSALIISALPRIEEKATIEGELVINGSDIIINGTVNGPCRIYGDNVRIAGTLNDNVYIEAKKISIAAPAFIKGDLNYVSTDQALIDVQSGVTILGNTTWDLPEVDESTTKNKDFFTLCIIEGSLLLAAFLFGVIIIGIARKYVVETVFQLKTRPALSFGAGIATISIFVISIIILLITFVLFIAGGVLISDDYSVLGSLILALATLLLPITSFAVVSGGILFYAGKIMIALLAGFYLSGLIYKNVVTITRKQLFIGLVLMVIICNIPYLGILAYIILSIIGAGGIILGIKNCRHDINKLSDKTTQ